MNPPLQRPGVVDRAVLAALLDNYVSMSALAGYSGLAERTLGGHIARPVHLLPHYRIGSRVVVRRSDFDQRAAQHRRVGVDLEERVERLQARAIKTGAEPKYITSHHGPEDDPKSERGRPAAAMLFNADAIRISRAWSGCSTCAGITSCAPRSR